ncbi:hypothetical protein [Streptomyces mesophilus]|uniref:hypothetical protein n=1 Tax=Streptomyces mesophilus TaxID=1775132 RepID=UPI00332BD2E1
MNTSAPDNAMRAVARRKLSIPAPVRQAAAVREALRHTIYKPIPERPGLPGKAADVEQVIRDHAQALHLHDLTHRAATQFSDEADLRYAAAVANAVPDWITGLQKEFTTLVGVITEAAAQLPAEVRADRVNWNDAAVSAPYQRAEGAAVQLDQLVSDRNDIARAGGHDGGTDNALYAIAHLPEPTAEAVMAGRWKELSPTLNQWRDLKRQPVARWVHLVRSPDVALSLATPGQVRERAATVQSWRDAEVTRLHGGSITSALHRVERSLAA